MKLFISSLIDALRTERSAAKQADIDLGHDTVMAADFYAQPRSSQIACLDGVRQCSGVILILGRVYGNRQSSGLSATHEENREPRAASLPIFAFVRETEREADQQAFVRDAEQWKTGCSVKGSGRRGTPKQAHPGSASLDAFHRDLAA
jgi:hypothetical protein